MSLPVVQRLLSIRGNGIVTATALWAWVGDVERFRSCRSFANYLGLTPREFSSGEKRRLGHISRQGNDYLRTLLVHGARSILRIAQRHPNDPLCRWATKLRLRSPHNKAAVGVANKLARIAWAVWKQERLYKSEPQWRLAPCVRNSWWPGAIFSALHKEAGNMNAVVAFLIA